MCSFGKIDMYNIVIKRHINVKMFSLFNQKMS